MQCVFIPKNHWRRLVPSTEVVILLLVGCASLQSKALPLHINLAANVDQLVTPE
jgi:hypothetical protein